MSDSSTTGPLVTDLRLNSLKDLKEKLIKSSLSAGEILSIIVEAETLHQKLETIAASQGRLIEAVFRLNQMVWDHMDDSVDINQLRDEIDMMMRIENLNPARTDAVKMQDLLARFLHKVKVDGSILQTDELVRDVIRFMNDAELINNFH